MLARSAGGSPAPRELHLNTPRRRLVCSRRSFTACSSDLLQTSTPFCAGQSGISKCSPKGSSAGRASQVHGRPCSLPLSPQLDLSSLLSLQYSHVSRSRPEARPCLRGECLQNLSGTRRVSSLALITLCRLPSSPMASSRLSTSSNSRESGSYSSVGLSHRVRRSGAFGVAARGGKCSVGFPRAVG